MKTKKTPEVSRKEFPLQLVQVHPPRDANDPEAALIGKECRLRNADLHRIRIEFSQSSVLTIENYSISFSRTYIYLTTSKQEIEGDNSVSVLPILLMFAYR